MGIHKREDWGAIDAVSGPRTLTGARVSNAVQEIRRELREGAVGAAVGSGPSVRADTVRAVACRRHATVRWAG